MDTGLPSSETLSGQILRSAMCGLMALRAHQGAFDRICGWGNEDFTGVIDE
jgi:hypothetical protein